MSAPVTLAVLAGGASRRMGADKPVMAIGGTTMLDLVLGAASGLPTLVVGREHPDHRWVADPTPERRGPLGGLVAALSATDGDVILVAADQPWLRRETVAALAALAPSIPTAPIDAGIRQTLCARYPPKVLPAARRLLTAGKGLQALLDEESESLPQAVWSQWGEDGRSWFSVDTPALLGEGLERYGPPR